MKQKTKPRLTRAESKERRERNRNRARIREAVRSRKVHGRQ